MTAGTKRWANVIGQCVQTSRPQCHFSDRQLIKYLMQKIDQHNEEQQSSIGKRAQAVSVLGLQIPPAWASQQRVWVFNEKVQLDEDGLPVSLSESPYVWLSNVCEHRVEFFRPNKAGVIELIDPSKRASVTMQLEESCLDDLLLALDDNYEENFPGVLLTIGGYVISVHYESLMEEYGKVPATIVYGEVQCGKSEATKATLATTGTVDGNFFTMISDARAFAYTSQTTLGIVIDDPSDLKEISKKLLYHFSKANATTMHYSYKPRTTFISSMNVETLDKLAKHSR